MKVHRSFKNFVMADALILSLTSNKLSLTDFLALFSFFLPSEIAILTCEFCKGGLRVFVP